MEGKKKQEGLLYNTPPVSVKADYSLYEWLAQFC